MSRGLCPAPLPYPLAVSFAAIPLLFSCCVQSEAFALGHLSTALCIIAP